MWIMGAGRLWRATTSVEVDVFSPGGRQVTFGPGFVSLSGTFGLRKKEFKKKKPKP